jgi:hypothetical protein
MAGPFILSSRTAKRPLTAWRPIESEEELLGMIAKMRGDVAEAKDNIGDGMPYSARHTYGTYTMEKSRNAFAVANPWGTLT